VKIITVNPSKCTGCRLCELACSLKNAGEFNPSKSRLRVIGFEELFSLPLMCFQCEKPHCAEVCPTGAITRDEATGVVRVSKEKCSGCKMCTLACPFGNIVFSADVKRVLKCELCDHVPECVDICPTGALEFKEADNATLNKRRMFSEKLKSIYGGVEAV
jgi:carbon-monoxide dehydrogenase iron sulfur subunit